jgi:hypothetical protein
MGVVPVEELLQSQEKCKASNKPDINSRHISHLLNCVRKHMKNSASNEGPGGKGDEGKND